MVKVLILPNRLFCLGEAPSPSRKVRVYMEARVLPQVPFSKVDHNMAPAPASILTLTDKEWTQIVIMTTDKCTHP